MRSWRPQHTTAGFVLPTGEDVVLELRSKSQPQLILHDRDLVLHERAVNVVVLMMWRKVHGRDCLYDVARTPSRAQPPNDFISLLENEMVNQVEVKGVPGFSHLGPQTVSAVVVGLNLKVRRIAEFTAPPTQEIAARYVFDSVHVELSGWRIRADSHLLPDLTFVKIALNRERVAIRQPRIRSEPRLSQLPGIIVIAIGMEFWQSAKTHSVGAIVQIIPVPGPVASS